MPERPSSPFDLSDAGPAPMAGAAGKAAQRKRFWRVVEIVQVEGGFGITLDGRPVRTPRGQLLTAPDRAVADALAAEWRAVGAVMDPAAMPLSRLINSALDGVANEAGAVRADIAKYARSDLVCYRASEPDKLAARQQDLWDPLLQWAREALGAQLVLAEGVMFVDQPQEAIAAIAEAVGAVPAPHALAALHVATTLTGSAILALALARGAIDRDAAWAAAHADEDVQMENWGEDEEALQRRALRKREFEAAALLLGR